jgi:hypothetical protein
MQFVPVAFAALAVLLLTTCFADNVDFLYLKVVLEKLNAADSIEHQTDQDLARASKKDQRLDIRHFTARLAWHDNGWNGR